MRNFHSQWFGIWSGLWQDEQLGPLQHSARDDPLATELDSFQVMSVVDRIRTAIWIRLVGPGLSLSLKLAAPRAGYTQATMKLSMEAIPECHWNMVEVEVETRSYFADLYFFILQHDLHRWDFSRDRGRQEFTECLYWA